jgi:hypothetical protein
MSLATISLWQPFASLIAIGAKTIETRHWSTKHRGPMAIHAAKREPKHGERIGEWTVTWEGQRIDFAPGPHSGWFMRDREPHVPSDQGCWVPLPLGAVVATCQLVDVAPVESIVWKPGEAGWLGIPAEDAEMPHDYIESYEGERPYGDYSAGRYGWLLACVKPVAPPIPAKGRQGIWRWDP